MNKTIQHIFLLFSTPFFLFFLFFSVTQAEEITVQVSGGIEKIESFRENNIDYFSMSELVDLLGEGVTWETVGLSARYEVEKHRTIIFVNSPYINIDDTVKNLIYPARLRKGCLFLPARTFLPLMDLMRPEQISWDEEHRTIRIDSEWYNIIDLVISSKANGLLIEIFVTEPLTYEIYLSEGNWLNVTIMDGRINRRQILSRRVGQFFRDMNTFQFEASSQISFRLRKPIGKYSHRFQANPGRIQISLQDTTVIPTPPSRIDSLGPDERIDRIVIDAGHGGKDRGAIGLKKTQEKKIVLDIAKRLAKLIRKEKLFEVTMTREKDKYVSLEKRGEIANRALGDIFISIHANASPKRTARGFQVFFLAPANNDEARAAAQLENAPFLAEMNAFDDDEGDHLSHILSDMIQTEFQVESADLAAMVDKEFRKILKGQTIARGMDQAGFVVLNKVYMPSILVEAAFLTNKKDEKLLRSKKYRQQVAEAIYAGLKRFKNKYEKTP
jgi:N-acetylmuramoyl-L-alanine amidase